MAPFVLCMTRVPLYVSDNEIVRAWKNYNGSVVKAVRFEPSELAEYRKATVWFINLIGYLPHPHYSEGQTVSTMLNNYKKKQLPGAERAEGLIGFLEPCSTSFEEPSEFSFMIAFQLQDVVRDQHQLISNLFGRDDDRSHQIDSLDKCIKKVEIRHIKQIEHLEARVNKMKKRIQEGTKLQLDINQCNIEEINQLEVRIQSQEDYNNRLEERIIALEAKMASDAREKEELKQKIDALTEWCSQPVWKRTSAFVLPKGSEDEFVNEF